MRSRRARILLQIAGLMIVPALAGAAPEDGMWVDGNPAAGNFPAPRHWHAVIVDSPRDRMILFGGNDEYPGADFNDVWALSLSGNPLWTSLVPGGSVPALAGHSMIYDPVRDRAVVFGGEDSQGLFRNEVWVLSLSGNPEWSLMTPAGTPPSGRAYHSAIYDPVRDRMVVYKGYCNHNDCPMDVWSLSLSGSPTWSTIETSGAPPPARWGHSAIYDPVRDRMVVYGEFVSSPVNAVAALSLGSSPTWTPLANGDPPPRSYHSAIYDSRRDRMVIFGGDLGSSSSFIFSNSVYTLDFGSQFWTQLFPTGVVPEERASHSAVYDSVGNRMVVFGGRTGTGGTVAIPMNDVRVLTWVPQLSAPIEPGAPANAFELAPPRPNPSGDETSVDFRLPVPARVTLDVFDAQGHKVKRIAEGWLPAGPHTGTWRGDDESGRPVKAGVYFISMRTAGFMTTRRTVRFR